MVSMRGGQTDSLDSTARPVGHGRREVIARHGYGKTDANERLLLDLAIDSNSSETKERAKDDGREDIEKRRRVK